MNRSDQLDKIIDFLYDKDTLHWQGKSAIELIAFGNKKFNLNMTDPELGFVLKYLTDEGYIKLEKGDNPKYYLTTKGILFKEQGGFRKANRIKFIKDLLYQISIIAVIIAGIYYLLEIARFIFCPPFCPPANDCRGNIHNKSEEKISVDTLKNVSINNQIFIDTVNKGKKK